MIGSHTRWSLCAGALAAFAPLLWSAPAAAQQPVDPRVEAKERYEHGVDLFTQGDYAGALGDFARAAELAPLPIVLYNLGQTYAALGRPVEAIAALDRVLADPGKLAPDRVERARTTRREQAALLGEVAVTVSVAGARIEIDAVEVATAPLAAPLRVKAGPHRIGAVATGFAPARKEVVVAAGSRADLSLELEPTDKKLAHVTVKTHLPGATVLVDDEVVGSTPLAASLAVLPGHRRLELRRAGYWSASREIDIVEGSMGEVELEPEPDGGAIRAEAGLLALDISEDLSVVSVDGRSMGRYQGSLTLAPGPHRILIERGGFLATDRDVVVSAHRTTTVRVRLEPSPETRAAHASKVGTQKTVGYLGMGVGVALAGASVGLLVWNSGQRSAVDTDVAAFNVKQNANGECDSLSAAFTDQRAKACLSEREDLDARRSALGTRDVLGYVGIGLGAAVAGVGASFLIWGDDPAKYDRPSANETFGLRSVRPSVAIGPRVGLLTLAGAF